MAIEGECLPVASARSSRAKRAETLVDSISPQTELAWLESSEGPMMRPLEADAKQKWLDAIELALSTQSSAFAMLPMSHSPPSLAP